MRRQTGNENDWLNILNAAGNLAGTVRQSQSQGLQLQNIEDQRKLAEQSRMHGNYAQDWVASGKSPEELMGKDYAKGMGGPGYQGDYNNVNQGLKASETISPENFTRSQDKIDKSMMSESLTGAVIEKAQRFKAAQDNLYGQYKNKFLTVPIDQLLKMPEVVNNDYSKYGNEASAASRAVGEILSEYSRTPEMRNKIEADNIKYADDKAKEFINIRNYARNLLGRGDKESAISVMVDAVNNSNLAHRARVTKDGKIQLGIVTEGIPEWGSAKTPAQFLSEMEKLSDRDYARMTWAAIKHAKQMTEDGAKDPTVLVNKNTGEAILARPWFNPRGGDNRWIISVNGSDKIINELGDIYKEGFVPLSAMGKLSGGKTGKNRDVRGEQFAIDLASKQALAKAVNTYNLPLSIGENDEIMATRPLTQDEAVTLANTARAYGLSPILNRNAEKRGLGMLSDKISYQFGGFVPSSEEGSFQFGQQDIEKIKAEKEKNNTKDLHATSSEGFGSRLKEALWPNEGDFGNSAISKGIGKIGDMLTPPKDSIWYDNSEQDLSPSEIKDAIDRYEYIIKNFNLSPEELAVKQSELNGLRAMANNKGLQVK